MQGFGVAGKQEVNDAEAEQAHRCNREPHDRTTEEGYRQGGRGPLVVCCGGGPDIGAGGGVHADVAGGTGGQSAHEEAKCGSCAEKDVQQDQQDGGENGHHLVFALHEYHGAKMNLVADFDDLAFAFWVFLDLPIDIVGCV